MNLVHPCRHGSYRNDCIPCSNDRVARAVEKQTDLHKETLENQRRDLEREKVAQADQRRKDKRDQKQQAREQSEEEDRQFRADAAERRAARQQAQWEAEQRSRDEHQEQKLQAIEARAAERAAAAQQKALEERTRWRANYKQETGVVDEDLVEVAWLSHRDRQERLAELDLLVSRVGRAAGQAADALRLITGLARPLWGLPSYVPDPQAADEEPVARLERELSGLSRFSLRRGALESGLAVARKALAHEQREVARILASNQCWERTGFAVQQLRKVWPSTFVHWGEYIDEAAISLLSSIPSGTHELNPSVLVDAGLDLQAEVQPVLSLISAVNQLPDLTAEATDYANKILDEDERLQ